MGPVQKREKYDDIDHGRKLRSGAVQERVLTMQDIEEEFKIMQIENFVF